jgi:hypothetical protein
MNKRDIPDSLKGYLLAYIVEDLHNRELCIYGDPDGLRSLGEAIIAIANLDQKILTEKECPEDDSFHKHYTIGIGTADHVRKKLPRLTIGRVDEKGSGEIRDYFPELEAD